MIDSGSRDCFSSCISLTFVADSWAKKTTRRGDAWAPGLPRRTAWWIWSIAACSRSRRCGLRSDLAALLTAIMTKRSASFTGSGRKSKTSAMLKMAVLATMPWARVRMAMAVDFRRCRRWSARGFAWGDSFKPSPYKAKRDLGRVVEW
jgi:hypothetical protein